MNLRAASLLLLLWAPAAFSAAPCCAVVAIDAKSGIVNVKDLKTGKVIRYMAEPAGVRALAVGTKVDLVRGQLRTATGAAIAGRVRP